MLNGELIRWAREELNLSLRQVRELGGPAKGYQSEIESGEKQNPATDVRKRLFQILEINESFARGEIYRYRDRPDLCFGLAADVGARLMSEGSLGSLSPLMRTRTVLHHVCHHSQKLTRVIVAYIMGISLEGLTDLLSGLRPVNRTQVEILSKLTNISVEVLTEPTSSDND